MSEQDKQRMQDLTCGACLTRIGRNESDIEKLGDNLSEIKATLQLILQQTTKTNGRVTQIEKDLNENYDGDKELQTRVRRLEDNMLRAYAYVAGISGTIGVIGAVIGKML